MINVAESTKTYTDQIEFWHWGELFALSNLVDSARHYARELILAGIGKLECNKQLQAKFNINKRFGNSIYTEVQAIVSNIDENRANHIKVLGVYHIGMKKATFVVVFLAIGFFLAGKGKWKS